jgi:hypothetical protein
MEVNHFKTNNIRVLGEVDIKPILMMLPALIKEWDKEEDFEVNHNKKHSLSQVNHINFRWSDKKSEPVEYFDLRLWDQFKEVLLPILIKTVQPIGYKKGFFPRIMLAKMAPGTKIPDHIDGKTKGWIPHKIHIPIVTNQDAIFFIDREGTNFKKGTAYEVNNGTMHGVENNGTTVRIHLIFEYLDAEINDVPTIDFQ